MAPVKQVRVLVIHRRVWAVGCIFLGSKRIAIGLDRTSEHDASAVVVASTPPTAEA